MTEYSLYMILLYKEIYVVLFISDLIKWKTEQILADSIHLRHTGEEQAVSYCIVVGFLLYNLQKKWYDHPAR